MRGPNARLRGRIPASGAPATRFGAPPILIATLRAGTNFGLLPPALGERSFGAETGAGGCRNFCNRGLGRRSRKRACGKRVTAPPCRSPCPYSRYGLREASRPEPKS